MPQGYSQEDFAKMQQQAINRVREMQRQAASGENGKSRAEPQQSAPPFSPQRKPGFSPPSAERPKKDEKKEPPKEPPFEKPPAPKSERKSPPPITRVKKQEPQAVPSFFNIDSDAALILPLLLLLRRDGADEMLILALLYIMA